MRCLFQHSCFSIELLENYRIDWKIIQSTRKLSNSWETRKHLPARIHTTQETHLPIQATQHTYIHGHQPMHFPTSLSIQPSHAYPPKVLTHKGLTRLKYKSNTQRLLAKAIWCAKLFLTTCWYWACMSIDMSVSLFAMHVVCDFYSMLVLWVLHFIIPPPLSTNLQN